MKDVAIIGAGIGGLALAHYLKRSGRSVCVLDSAPRPGGAIKTRRKECCLLEYGPHSTFAKDALADLVRDLELEGEVLQPGYRSGQPLTRYIADVRTKSLRPLPRSALHIFSSPLLSHRARMRILLEPFFKRSSLADESVHSLMARRLGQEAAEEVVATVLSGIWAADTGALSCRSALPRVWNFDQKYGSLLWGLLREYEGKKKLRPKMMSFRRGMGALVEALAAELDGDLLTNSAVTRLETRSGAKVRVHFDNRETCNSISFLARSVVLAAPAPACAALLRGIDPGFAAHISSVPYAPIGVLHLALHDVDDKRVHNGSGFLVPPNRGSILLGAIFSSTLFPERAPAGTTLITCFTGGSTNPRWADVRTRQVRERAVRELQELVPGKGRPHVIDASFVDNAIPNYPVGHHLLRERVRDFCRAYPQISVLGSWDEGIGVAQRVEMALELSRSIERHLEQPAAPVIRLRQPKDLSKRAASA